MDDSSDETVIRPADPERDIPSLVELNRFVQDIHAAAEPAFFRPSTDMPGIERFHLGFTEGERRYTFVAEVGTGLVGYVSLEHQRRDAHPFAWAQNRLYIHQVGVHPRHRRAGVGRALMRRVEELATELGVAEVALDTWSFNTEARRFFEALGYEVHGFRLRKRASE